MVNFIVRCRAVFFIFFIVLLFTGCAKTQEEKELSSNDKNVTIKLEGTVYPAQQQEILAAVPGYVKKIYVKNGDRVRQNDILYSLDKQMIKLDIENTKNEIKSLEEIRDNMYRKGSNIAATNLAAIELEKMTTLKSHGYVSEFELNEYKKNYINTLFTDKDARTTNYENIKRQAIEINQKKLELQKLEFQYTHADTYAKISGFVTGLSISEGENVDINKKVCRIENIDNVIVKAGFAKGLLPYIKTNTKVEINFVTTPPYTAEARIQKVIPIINPSFDRMTIDMQVPNENYILQPTTRALVVVPLNKEAQKEVKKYFIGKSNQSVLEIKSKN